MSGLIKHKLITLYCIVLARVNVHINQPLFRYDLVSIAISYTTKLQTVKVHARGNYSSHRSWNSIVMVTYFVFYVTMHSNTINLS